jgi:hypothetical protein
MFKSASQKHNCAIPLFSKNRGSVVFHALRFSEEQEEKQQQQTDLLNQARHPSPVGPPFWPCEQEEKKTPLSFRWTSITPRKQCASVS